MFNRIKLLYIKNLGILSYAYNLLYNVSKGTNNTKTGLS